MSLFSLSIYLKFKERFLRKNLPILAKKCFAICLFSSLPTLVQKTFSTFTCVPISSAAVTTNLGVRPLFVAASPNIQCYSDFFWNSLVPFKLILFSLYVLITVYFLVERGKNSKFLQIYPTDSYSPIEKNPIHFEVLQSMVKTILILNVDAGVYQKLQFQISPSVQTF